MTDRTPRSGWAYGEIARSADADWLTIPGSAHTAPDLHSNRDAAQTALAASPAATWPNFTAEVAHVTEVPHPGVTGRGFAYRISEAEPEAGG